MVSSKPSWLCGADIAALAGTSHSNAVARPSEAPASSTESDAEGSDADRIERVEGTGSSDHR